MTLKKKRLLKTFSHDVLYQSQKNLFLKVTSILLSAIAFDFEQSTNFSLGRELIVYLPLFCGIPI